MSTSRIQPADVIKKFNTPSLEREACNRMINSSKLRSRDTNEKRKKNKKRQKKKKINKFSI